MWVGCGLGFAAWLCPEDRGVAGAMGGVQPGPCRLGGAWWFPGRRGAALGFASAKPRTRGRVREPEG